MVFSSLVFLFAFLPIVLAMNFMGGRKFRNALLLLASLLFYAWGETFFVFLMVLSICLNYMAGILISHYRNHALSSWTLALVVGINLGLLATFKYADFLVDALNSVATMLGASPVQRPEMHLPIGISFFTFQAISYVVDVYRGTSTSQKNILSLGLYISLFPQLIAGPIIRYHDIAKQLVQRHVTLDDFSYGTRRFVIGLAKKVLIANTLAVAVDQIFTLSPAEMTVSLAWLGIVCYALQIYFDFSGYSDMAIGLGRMFGFRYLENFNYPYISRSIQEFWRRWHISLSNWFRDYLYIPLGGNRKGPRRMYFNLFVVFLLCGLWHGANWTFVVWGAMHGLFLTLERNGLGRLLDSLWAPLRHAYVLLVVLVSWVFFRSESLLYAFEFLQRMFGFGTNTDVMNGVDYYLSPELLMTLLAASIFSAPWQGFRQHFNEHSNALARSIYDLSILVILICFFVTSVMYLAAGIYNPFIYFRF